jgi:integrase
LEAAEPEWRLLFLTAIKTGVRLGELSELRVFDINFEKGLLRVSRSYYRGEIEGTKSGRGRSIPLCDELFDALLNHKKQHGLSKNDLLFSDKKGNNFRDGRLKWPLYRACKKAGLEKSGWHVLRHTFGSHCAMRGVPMRVLQQWMGHRDISTTLRYAHLSPENSNDWIKLLDPDTQGKDEIVSDEDVEIGRDTEEDMDD